MRTFGWIILGLLGCLATAPYAHAQDPAQAINQKKAEQLFVRGMTRAFLDDFEGARDLYEEALALAPNNAAILSALAAAHEGLGDETQALYYARQARQHAPAMPDYHRLLAQMELRAGHPGQAADAYRTLLERFPDDLDALRELASIQAMMDQPREALATYRQLLARGGDRPDVWRQMLDLYFQLGDETGTREALETLVRYDPSDPAPWRLLGQLHLQRDRLDDALDAFERAHAVDPGDFETTLALADLYRQRGEGARAEALLGAAGAAPNADPDALVARAEALLGQDDEGAVRLLQRALDQHPDHAAALRLLGDLRYRQGDFTTAAALLERALEQDPRDPERWYRAATAYAAAGRPEDAVRVADDGLLLFPGQLPLLRAAAAALGAAGQPDDAHARIAEAVAIIDEDPAVPPAEQAAVFELAGDLYAAQGDADAATRYWRRALDHDPASDTLLGKLERQAH